MAQPWEAKQVVSPELAVELVERQFPELAPADATLVGVGWDNTAYLVNATWVFRFPRRDLAVELIETEAALLPWLAPQLPLPISAPRFVGKPGDEFPWPFAGYAFMPGTSASDLNLNDEQRLALAAPLGKFLSALHATSPSEAARHGAPEDTLGRLQLDKRTRQIEERLARCVELELLPAADPWLEVVADVPRDWSYGPTHVVHGDLYARHLLVDSTGQPSGVIDWGDVHLGHPAVDLSIAASLLPPRARAAFLDTYGPIDPDSWRMARFKAILTSLALLDYGTDVGDKHLAREGRVALENVLVG